MKYVVEIKEELSKLVCVDSADIADAIVTVKQKYMDSEIVLSHDDFMDVEFEHIEDMGMADADLILDD